jgi:hypothetical protein
LPPPPLPDLPAPLTPPAPGAKIEAPPIPPGPMWIIYAYQWVNGGWVKQPDHCLETPNLKQAADYCLELSHYQDGYYRANVPLACCDVSIKPNATLPSSAPVPSVTPHTTMTVWAFKFTGGKWVKDEKYCWSASDYFTLRIDMLAYAKKLNTIPGWCATTNAPDCVRGQPLPATRLIPPAPPAPPAPAGK